ncbi:protein adenylyltransferase SelO [Salinisphaera aquimarina]|uniref:Protein nucleotidyltransferase YdiU n=1 Tax=Salinisphaera aquimarina TaxID=2094031 RepID=A0ABV7ELY9_9GAMM
MNDSAAVSTVDVFALNWVNRQARLGEPWFFAQTPTPLSSPYPIAFNDDVAALLDIDADAARAAGYTQTLAGNCLPDGAEPTSHRYGGHQFGVWAGQLGDGRAITLGDIRNARGQSYEIQLKGAGKTPFSRFADGRAVLRSAIREYLGSEALAALNIPTTRALAMVGSDAPVYRETVETAAVMTRVAPSLVRFGSFEVLFEARRFDDLAPLADHVIGEHFPELAGIEDDYARYKAWVEIIIERTAGLIADWQAVGFCHGVLNTDNMSVLGLTLDYGPYGFMDSFDPGWICNHTDEGGRYAYDQQPHVGLWNLGRFVQSILPLLSEVPDDAVAMGQQLLERYRGIYDNAYMARMRAKLGLIDAREDDRALLESLLKTMARDGADFTRTFRALGHVSSAPDAGDAPFIDEFADRDAASAWLADWRQRLGDAGADDAPRAERMRLTNPKYILRNYLAQNAIDRAQDGDFSELERLHALLRRPFDEQPDNADYARLPPDWARGLVLSCSS